MKYHLFQVFLKLCYDFKPFVMDPNFMHDEPGKETIIDLTEKDQREQVLSDKLPSDRMLEIIGEKIPQNIDMSDWDSL